MRGGRRRSDPRNRHRARDGRPPRDRRACTVRRAGTQGHTSSGKHGRGPVDRSLRRRRRRSTSRPPRRGDHNRASFRRARGRARPPRRRAHASRRRAAAGCPTRRRARGWQDFARRAVGTDCAPKRRRRRIRVMPGGLERSIPAVDHGARTPRGARRTPRSHRCCPARSEHCAVFCPARASGSP